MIRTMKNLDQMDIILIGVWLFLLIASISSLSTHKYAADYPDECTQGRFGELVC